MNCQNFSNLQFRPLLKNSIDSIHNDLTDISGEKIPFVTVDITRLVLMFKRVPTLTSNTYDTTKWLLQAK